MCTSDDVLLQILDVDEDVVIASIAIPNLTLEVIGRVTVIGHTLLFQEAHVQGGYPGALGRAGLNAICRRVLEEIGVDQVVIEGGARTTGRNPWRAPKPFRFPSR
jgi:hypothetical protein